MLVSGPLSKENQISTSANSAPPLQLLHWFTDSVKNGYVNLYDHLYTRHKDESVSHLQKYLRKKSINEPMDEFVTQPSDKAKKSSSGLNGLLIIIFRSVFVRRNLSKKYKFG
jgi:hypothetical protein